MNKNFEATIRKPSVIFFSAVLCCILWGSAYPFIKISYNLFSISSDDTATIILVAGLRFIIAGIMSITGVSIVNRKFMHPQKSNIKQIGLLSLSQTVGQYIFFYVGLAHTSGVNSSIIKGLNVVMTILVSCLIFRQEKLTARKITGCVVGFMGVLVMNIFNGGISTNFSVLGEGFIFMSTISSAFSSTLSKKFAQNINPVLLSGWQFFLGGIILTVGGLLFGGHISTFSVYGMLTIVFLAFVSSVAFSLWTILLKYNTLSKVTVYNFMNPVFGVILSALLLNEKDMINLYCIISLILVSLGIYIINKNKSPDK